MGIHQVLSHSAPLVKRENLVTRRARAGHILDGLKKAYPDARCELDFRNPLELLVATILSAQSTDKQVNVITPELFKKYRTAAHYAVSSFEELSNDLRRIGLFRNKARNLQACCKALVEKHRG